MTDKELDDKIDILILNLASLTLNWLYGDKSANIENKKKYRDKYSTQFIKARKELKELLNISTHQHQKTDLFK